MSRYKPYPQYKDSGVEWLGEVPEHWEKGLLSNLFTNNKEKNSGMFNNNLLSLSYGKIVNKDIETSFGLLPESFESYQIVHDGYIVLRLTDLQNDQKSLRTGFVTQTGIITSAYVGLKKKSKFIGNEKYFYLYLHTFDVFKGFYGMGSGVRQSLNYDELKKLQFILPSLNEQNAIVNFLDNATCKIDTLIQKQQNLIELLKEKRQALISHAVTKGLNPHVKMKDSGVEWLGEVPEHWEIKKLKHNISRLESGTSVNTADVPAADNEYGVLKTSSVYTGTFRPKENKTVVKNEISRLSCPLKLNTLIVSRMNTPDLVGAAGLVIDAPANIYLPDRLWQITFKDALPNMIHYLTLTSGYRGYIHTVCDGTSSSMQNLSQDNFKNFINVLPPIKEQQVIVNYLDNATCKIDTLIAKAQKAIELLKERRTALISATVTGKIDVREIA